MFLCQSLPRVIYFSVNSNPSPSSSNQMPNFFFFFLRKISKLATTTTTTDFDVLWRIVQCNAFRSERCRVCSATISKEQFLPVWPPTVNSIATRYLSLLFDIDKPPWCRVVTSHSASMTKWQSFLSSIREVSAHGVSERQSGLTTSRAIALPNESQRLCSPFSGLQHMVCRNSPGESGTENRRKRKMRWLAGLAQRSMNHLWTRSSHTEVTPPPCYHQWWMPQHLECYATKSFEKVKLCFRAWGSRRFLISLTAKHVKFRPQGGWLLPKSTTGMSGCVLCFDCC